MYDRKNDYVYILVCIVKKGAIGRDCLSYYLFEELETRQALQEGRNRMPTDLTCMLYDLQKSYQCRRAMIS